MAEDGINVLLKAAGESEKDRIATLEERLKELNCLYAVTELVHTPGLSLTETPQRSSRMRCVAWWHRLTNDFYQMRTGARYL